MFQMPQHRQAAQGRLQSIWQSALPVQAVRKQIHTPPNTPGLPAEDAAAGREDVRRWDTYGDLRRIARHLGVNHQSVANWVKAYAAQLPPAPLPDEVETIEMDELHTFIEDKKTKPTS